MCSMMHLVRVTVAPTSLLTRPLLLGASPGSCATNARTSTQQEHRHRLEPPNGSASRHARILPCLRKWFFENNRKSIGKNESIGGGSRLDQGKPTN